MSSEEDPFRDNGEPEPDEPADLKRSRRRRDVAGEIERLPPHSHEAEQGSIGCMILDPNTCIPEAIRILGSDDTVFYDLRHQTIYAHVLQMHDNQKPIDLITLQQRLSDFDLLDQVGGIVYLAGLCDGVTSTANFSYYAEILKEKFLLRKTVATCTTAVNRIYTHEGQVEELMDSIEREILSIRRSSITTGPSAMRELVPDSLARIEAMARGEGVNGIRTGFVDYDRMTGGLVPGEMILIAARPSLGKTSLAMNIAEHVAVTLRLPVGVFSLEMTKASLTDRMIFSRARVSSQMVRQQLVTEKEISRITQAGATISAAPIYIDDTAGLSIMQLRARARAMYQQFGIKLFVVDYLQLLNSETRRAKDSRQQEVSEISCGIKSLAKELNVPALALSQLNRDLEKTKRAPALSDLRESGSLEQDADIVGLLYRPAVDDEQVADEADCVPIQWNIAKSRNGPRGEISLLFLKNYTRFESAAKVSDDDVPASEYRSPYPETEPLPLSTQTPTTI